MWTFDESNSIALLTGHKNQSYALVLSPDGSRLLSGGEDETVRIWNLDRTQPIVLEGHSGVVTAVAWTRDARRVVSASGDGDHSIRIWDVEQRQQLKILHGHTAYVSNVSVLSDGLRAVSSALDDTVILWNLENGSPMARFKTEGAILCHKLVQTSPTEVIAIAGDEGGRVHFLKLENLPTL